MEQGADQGVGVRIKRLREEREWSMAKLAVEADMSVSGVSMIENGKRNLTTTTLAKLARAFGVEVADLFPKAQAPLPLESAGRSGADDGSRYTAFEAFGRALAFGWEDDLKEWEEKIPEGVTGAPFDFARLVQWVLEIAGTKAVYEAVARDLDSTREELADTLRLLEQADRAAVDKLLRVFEPAKTYKEFREIVEANDLEAIVSGTALR